MKPSSQFAWLLLVLSLTTWAEDEAPVAIHPAAESGAVLVAGKSAATGAEVVQGLQSLTPAQLDKVLTRYDKFDDNTKRQFKDALAKPNPFVIALLTNAANRIAAESRQQLAETIAQVKAGK